MSANDNSKVRQKSWAFLQSQGFPSISDKVLRSAVEHVEAQAFVSGKRLGCGGWRWVEGGEHGDDVAIVKLVAESLGLREGVDWDWGLEPDDYHLSIAYVDTPKTHELSRLVDLCHDADLVRLQVYTRHGENLSDGELQQLFREEWNKVRDEKLRMRQKSLKALEAFRRMPEA